MLLNIAIGTIMMMVTTAVHAWGMIMAFYILQSQGWRWVRRLHRFHVYRVGVVVQMMFLVSLVEVMIWASAYLALNAIEGLENALYFSMVTFTTLGYGDIVLHDYWRLLSSFEAANGIIMFGWTTAIVIAAVQRIYHVDESMDKKGRM